MMSTVLRSLLAIMDNPVIVKAIMRMMSVLGCIIDYPLMKKPRHVLREEVRKNGHPKKLK